MNPKLEAFIAHYAASHRDSRNEFLHCICVPAIVFAVIGAVSAFSIVLALIIIAVAILYYNRLCRRAALEMAVILAAMLLIWAEIMPIHHRLLSAIIIFIAAWIGQFVGHVYEGAKPSFLEDLQYLMIGPLYVLHVLKAKFINDPPARNH